MRDEVKNPDEMLPVPELPAEGRVSTYTRYADEIDDLVIRCGANGYSLAQMAACIGISAMQLHTWRDENPRFRAVFERAATLSQAWWEGRAMDGTANNLIGAAVWSKSMSARFPHEYTERREVSGGVVVKIGHEDAGL